MGTNCARSCDDGCGDERKKNMCKCKEGLVCDIDVCLGKCCTEEAWVDLTEGGKVVPTERKFSAMNASICTLLEDRAITGCLGRAVPVAALAMLLLTAW